MEQLRAFDEGLPEPRHLKNTFPINREIKGHRTKNEIRGIMESGDESMLRVLKIGKKTEMTVGRLNPWHNIRVEPYDIDGPWDPETTKIMSGHLAVLSLIPGKDLGEIGDSGACIFDRAGHVLGILCWATGHEMGRGASAYLTDGEYLAGSGKDGGW